MRVTATPITERVHTAAVLPLVLVLLIRLS